MKNSIGDLLRRALAVWGFLLSLLTGAATLASAPYFPYLRDHAVICSLAAALIVALGLLLWQALDPLSNFRLHGLVRVYLRREQASKTMRRVLSSASEIDMLGFNLYRPWLSDNDFVKSLRERAATGQLKSCRIILADINKPDELARRERIEDAAAGHLRVDGNASLAILSKLMQHMRPTLETRLVDADWLSCSIIRADKVIFVTPYLVKLGGRRTPTFMVRSGKLFDIYMEQYSILWKNTGTERYKGIHDAE